MEWRVTKSTRPKLKEEGWGSVCRLEEQSKQSPEACRSQAFRERESGLVSAAEVGMEDRVNASMKSKL